jgi:hypothetical protein
VTGVGVGGETKGEKRESKKVIFMERHYFSSLLSARQKGGNDLP